MLYSITLSVPDGTKEIFGGSTRFAYQVGDYDNILGTQNLSMCYPINVTQGVNHIFVMQRFATNVKKDHFRLYVFNRNMVVDINYL